VPAHFKVIVHARPRVSCRDFETIMQAPLPNLPIERGTPGPGLLAHVAASKYGYHLPLNRQSEMYEKLGMHIERSTMADWIGRMEFLLKPLADEIGRHVREGTSIHADDTPLPVLAPGNRKTKTARFWVAVRNEQTWGSTAPVEIYYQFAPDRKKERAASLLEGCRGYLHADGYSGFQALYQPDAGPQGEPLIEVACWAHARCYFHKEHVNKPTAAWDCQIQPVAKVHKGLFARLVLTSDCFFFQALKRFQNCV
jgi:transposase